MEWHKNGTVALASFLLYFLYDVETPERPRKGPFIPGVSLVRIRSPVPTQTVQVEKLGRFLFVCVALKIRVFGITSSSYTSQTHPKWHKLGIFLIFMNFGFSIALPPNRQHFIYTSHCFLLLILSGMDVAVDGGLNVGMSYDALNGLYRRSCVVQQRRIRMSEDVRRSPVEVDGASYTLHHTTMNRKRDRLLSTDDIALCLHRL